MKKRFIGGITALAVIFSLVGGPGDSKKVKADSQETIALLNFTYTTSSDAESATDSTLNKAKYGSAKTGYAFSTGKAKLFASIDGSAKRKLEWSKADEDAGSSSKEKFYTDSFAGNTSARQPVMTAGKKHTWGKNPYFEVELSTAGYKNINFSAYVGASKKGPRDYQISYATGSNTTFKAISGTAMQLTENKVMKRISAVVPADNQSTVRIRVEITSLTSINGGDMSDSTTMDRDRKTPNMKGEVAINHITVSGIKASSSTVDADSGSTSGTSSADSNYTVKKLTLNKRKLTLKKKKSQKLKVTVKLNPNTKNNVSDAKKKLVWSSSNKKVATVSKTGKVTAKKKGKAVITVKFSKKKKATCKITVK